MRCPTFAAARLTSCVIAALAGLLCLVACVPSLSAQSVDETPDWEVMRIFMPESLDSVVPRDYLTISLSELESLLSEDARRRQQSAGQAAGIQRAVYVARWSDQLLVSNASVWQTIRPGNAGPLTIGRTSLAVEEPIGLTGDFNPLTRNLRYLDDNRLQLGGGANGGANGTAGNIGVGNTGAGNTGAGNAGMANAEGQRDYWFGFRAKARRRDSGQQSLELVLPRALLATMLISVPQNATLSSNLPCLRIGDPSEFLPRDWPTSAIPPVVPAEQWYLLLLSGRDACTLNYTPARPLNQYPYRLSVASAQCEIMAQPAGMNVTSRFQLSKAPASGSLRVVLDDPLHVRSIQINGTESTNWHSIIDESKVIASRTIEIPCDGVGTGPMVLTINSVGRMSLPYDAQLPKVEISDAFVLDGRCVLSAQDRVQIEDVETAGQRLTTNSGLNGSTWQWQWTGKTPQTTARIKATTNQWTVRSLARFSLQKDVVVATAHVNVSSASVQGNQVALQLARGWFVDSVQIENAPLGVAVDVRELENAASQLSLHWEERRSDLDVRVIINAHYHQRTDVDQLQLSSTRIVSLPDADQQDTYVIEPSSRFQLKLNPELLRTRINEDELTGWQRALSSRMADTWIFRTDSSDLPTIDLERIRATFETRLHTTIVAGEKDATATYRVACKPISGSINQLRLMLPIPADAVAPTWSLVPRFDGSVPKGLQVTSRATSSSTGETSFTIELSQDVSEEFQIEAELRLPLETNSLADQQQNSTSQSLLVVPLPSIPQSVSQDTVVVLPGGYQLPAEVDSLEILPDGLCCSDGQLIDYNSSDLPDGSTNLNHKLVHPIVTARYDPNTVTHVHLVRSSERSDGAWIRDQLHQHWQHPDGRTVHRSTWQLALAEPLWLEIALPARWSYDALLVDGRVVTPEIKPGTDTRPSLRIRLPRGETTELVLKCTSRQKDAWSPWLMFEQPGLNLPVLQSHELVWFPSDVYAAQGWPKTLPSSQLPSSQPWFDRLWPGRWWQWLSPTAQPGSPALALMNRSNASPTETRPAKNGIDKSTSSNSDVGAATDAGDVGSESRVAVTSSIRGSFWWALSLDTPTDAYADVRHHVWWVDSSLVACVAMAISLIVAGCLLAVCGTVLRRWWLAWIIAVALLLLSPDWAMMPTQSAALGLSLATLLRLCQIVIQISKPTPRRGGDSVHGNFRNGPLRSKTVAAGGLSTAPIALSKSNPSIGSAVLLAIALGSMGLTDYANAQPFSKNAARDREEIFGILIPVDAENKVAGDLVYVPTRLYSLLNNSNQQDYKSGNVSVTAAFYSLNVLNDPISLTSTVGEITTELNVQANRAEAELHLPFRRDELQLQRAYVDSSSLNMGERLRQDAEQLVWRANDTERHSLRLVFRPKTINMKDGRGSLSVSIPAIPTAKLDVMGDDLRDVTVDAIGGTQLDSPRSLVARLGPTNKLSINWPLLLGRSSTVQVQSDTWLHTRGEQVMALCQLKVRGVAALPATLHVVGDTNWLPVGPDWEDYRMLSTEGVTASGRPVYTVERSSENGADTVTLRVLLLPKTDLAPTTLSIPFLSFQEVAAQQRSLAISHGESALWKANGTESFQPLLASQSLAIWEKARLAEQPSLFKVPTGALLATLSRLPSPTVPTVTEITEISLQSPEIKLKYSARWSQPLVGKASVRIQIPGWLKVDGAYVDSSPARFVQHALSSTTPPEPMAQSTTNSELNVLIDSNLGGLHSISLQLSAPTLLNKPWRLPHLLLQDAKIDSSVVQLYRGAELQSELRPIGDAPPVVERVDVRPSPLLLNLHSLIGQMELGERYRDSTELPIEVRLARAPTSRRAHSVMRLMRSDQGWRAQLDVMVDVAQGETNHLLIDLPRSLEASLREPVDTNVPIMLWPSGDANRTILSVLPPASSASRSHITLTFRLPSAGASQSIMVPDLRFLGLSIDRPVLALPTSIAGQDVRWSQVGRALPTQWLQNEGLQELELGEYSLHEPGGSQLQAVWSPSDRQEQGARLLLTRVALRPGPQSEMIEGHVGYWIEPRNQAYLTISLPPNCQLVGALAGNSPVPWNPLDDGRLRILMQPSYLPVRIHLFVKWSGVRGLNSSELQLPLPQLKAQSGGPMLVGLDTSHSDQTAAISWQLDSARQLNKTELENLLAQSLADTLAVASPIAADRDPDELRAWLTHWNPETLGIDESTLVSKPTSSSNPKSSASPDDESRRSLGDFWTDYLTRRSIIEFDSIPTPLATPRDRSESELEFYDWYQLPDSSSTTQLTLDVVAPENQPHSGQLAIIAAVWSIVAGCVWLFGHRRLEQLFSNASDLVWPIWFVLILLVGILLPVWWPSLILVACTLVVIGRRYRELRRDHQFIFRPRPAR